LYAAPEQLLNRPVGIATDIYQLGLLLYVLVAGRHPLQDFRGDWPELSERILNQPSRPPSFESEATAPITRVPRHRRQDLDAIVLRCLSKRPAARYPDTRGLLTDVRACLADRSVVALPKGRFGEAARFLRRNRRVSAVAGTAVALLLLVSGWYLQQLRVEQQRATDSADRADAVSAYLTDIIESADPLAGQGSNNLSDVISDSSFELGAATAGQTETQRELVLLSGKTLVNLGRFAAVIEMLEPLVAELESKPPPHPRRYAEYLSLLGYARYRAGDPMLGRKNLELALSLQEAATDTEPVSLAASLQRLGLLERRNGELKKAHELIQRGLTILVKALHANHQDIASARNHLGLVLADLGRLDESVAAFESAIEIHRSHADGQISAAMTLSNLADTERLANRLDAASRHADEAVNLVRGTASRNPQLLATALVSRGNVFLASENLDAAIRDYDEARIVYRTALSPEHPRVALVTHNLAMALRKAGRCEDAVPMYQDAIQIAARHYPEDHPQLMESRRQLALCPNDQAS
jgi:tetratricopeptide (TPR) repeat protein